MSRPDLDECAGADDLLVWGFVALWHDTRLTVEELSDRRGLADALVRAGRLVLDGDVVVGIHGLTVHPTAHWIEHPDSVAHTWCALDAVGIPAALGLDATAHTRCPTCGAALAAVLRAGDVARRGDAEGRRLWIPGGPCDQVVRDFCPHANLYCDADHLAASVPHGSPGRAVTLADAAALGRVAWHDVATALRPTRDGRP
jgi:Alkylmercury lyase